MMKNSFREANVTNSSQNPSVIHKRLIPLAVAGLLSACGGGVDTISPDQVNLETQVVFFPEQSSAIVTIPPVHGENPSQVKLSYSFRYIGSGNPTKDPRITINGVEYTQYINNLDVNLPSDGKLNVATDRVGSDYAVQFTINDVTYPSYGNVGLTGYSKAHTTLVRSSLSSQVKLESDTNGGVMGEVSLLNNQYASLKLQLKVRSYIGEAPSPTHIEINNTLYPLDGNGYTTVPNIGQSFQVRVPGLVLNNETVASLGVINIVTESAVDGHTYNNSQIGWVGSSATIQGR